jgi:DNA (cytosine-5)-methyltransferase 1
MARFKEIGYRAQLFLVNAADCGVPQKRERVFFVALRNDIDKPKLVLSPQHRWISAGEATSDLQVLTEEEVRDTKPIGTDLRFWDKTKPGVGYEIYYEQQTNKRGFFNHSKLHAKKPSNSLTSLDTHFTHWTECRSLSFREWKRLGSFPDDYQAKTDKIGKYMIGMSVPPRMMEKVAAAVVRQWLT